MRKEVRSLFTLERWIGQSSRQAEGDKSRSFLLEWVKIRFGDSQVEQSTLPTSLLYIPGSLRSSPWSEQRRCFLRGGLGSPKTSLLQKINSILSLGKIDPISFLRKQLLFLLSTSEFQDPWKNGYTTTLPLFDCLDIIPRKANFINITTRTVVPSFLFLTKTEWSAWLLLKPNSFTSLLTLSNQAHS